MVQKSIQLELPLESRGESPRVRRSGQAATAIGGNERPGTSPLMERVVDRSNLLRALKRVKQNRGSPGADGMTVEELPDHLREHWPALKEQLLNLDKPLKKLSRLRSTKLQYFPIPTHVSFSKDEANFRTIMEVTTTDKPGVLSRIGMAMEFCGVSLQGAKITTYGERVEDIFFITTESGSMVTDELKLECLRNSISDSLSLKK